LGCCAGLTEVAAELSILVGLILLLILGIAIVTRRVDQYEE
jgi:hypothetical protein